MLSVFLPFVYDILKPLGTGCHYYDYFPISFGKVLLLFPLLFGLYFISALLYLLVIEDHQKVTGVASLPCSCSKTAI